MSWICKRCETENPDTVDVCEVCNSLCSQPINDLQERYHAPLYKQVLRYQFSLLQSADAGNRNAQYELAEWFRRHNKNKSAESYMKEAFVWYTKAAKGGHGHAMYKLARCYEEGLGVSCSMYEAIKWYVKSAKSGYEKARITLAKLYLYGEKVTKDVAETVRWYGSIDFGLTPHDLNLIGCAFYTGDTVSKNYFKAKAYFKYAAEAGLPQAQYNLGLCYESGNGVQKDIEMSKYWYQKAEEQGYTEASIGLKRIMHEFKRRKRNKVWDIFLISILCGTICWYFIIALIKEMGLIYMDNSISSAIIISCGGAIVGLIVGFVVFIRGTSD